MWSAVLREMFPGVRPPWARITVYTAAVLMATALIRPDLYRVHSSFRLEDYSIVSLDLAISRAFCDASSGVTPLVSVAAVVRDQRELGETPARAIAADRAGSLQRFCETATVAMVHNEHSLMWLDSWLFRLAPDLSINGLARVLHGMRVAGVAVFLVLLLANGLGLIVAAISWWWALILLQDLADYVHHGYPFMLVMLLVTGVTYATVGQTGAARSRIGAGIVATTVGAWTAFAANMRTSHLPVYALFAIVLFVFSERAAATPRGRWQRLSLAAVAMLAGYAAFQYFAITRHLPAGDQALSRHTILHSTVIALAIPESDFSRGEGITWSDGAANAIALREQPGVTYLSVEYERALLRYYARLWRERTSEMLDVYRVKSQTAGKHMLAALRGENGARGRILNAALAPLDRLPNGIWLFVLYAGIAVASWRRAWQRPGAATALVYLSIAAVLLQMEAAIVMSEYVVNYQAYLAFFCIFITAAAPAGLLAAIWESRGLAESPRPPVGAENRTAGGIK
jgi:hypothetical protein